MKKTLLLAFWVATFGAPGVGAQTEPWWPHPIWGEGDQAGGSNWITPEKILEASRLVKSGQVYELGQGLGVL